MKRHALFVGVDKYDDSTIQSLAFSAEDASELASVFRLMLKFDRVEKLLNPAHAPEVVDAIKDMTRGLGAGDLFMFFFAGHGFQVKENHVLVCAKDEYADLEGEYAGLPVGQVKKRMRGPWNRMLVLDACRNDIRKTRGADCGVTSRDLALIHALDGDVSDAGFEITVTACSNGQKALEVADLGHGLFTSAFLDTLTAFADSRRRIDLESLRSDLGRRMSGLISQYRLSGRQEPMFTMPLDARGIILLDGHINVSQQSPSTHVPVETSALIVCPACGLRNRVENTFRCRVCGREYLCAEHLDKNEHCCEDCAAVKRKECEEHEAAECEARKEPNRKAHDVSLQGGASFTTGGCRTIALPGGATMEMIYCQPGEFLMGSPTTEEGRLLDETQHRVRLTNGFWLGRYPVTQAQWMSVMGTNPSRFEGADLPVEKVSWVDCQSFIRKVDAVVGCGVRLPTEAEWEYACRAGTTSAYFWGDALNGDKANCAGELPCGTTTKGAHIGMTTDVGKYRANPWGFYDMHGNVWEWCADWFGPYPSDSVTDPNGPASGCCRVLRGGDCDYAANCCRSASRNGKEPDRRLGNHTGFRICCSFPPPVSQGAGSSGHRDKPKKKRKWIMAMSLLLTFSVFGAALFMNAQGIELFGRDSQEAARFEELKGKGYFVLSFLGFRKAIWLSNRELEDYPHWLTDKKEGTWRIEDGYVLQTPGGSALSEVVWKPGWQKSPTVKAGDFEGTWLHRKKCPTCSGRKKLNISTDCLFCGGSGRITNTVRCQSCQGSGRRSQSYRCGSCNGAGRSNGSCRQCGGSGTSVCSNCSGSGRVVNPGAVVGGIVNLFGAARGRGGRIPTGPQYINCSSCGGNGRIRCGGCGGRGTVYSSCLNCSGHGQIIQSLSCNSCGGSGRTSSVGRCSHCKNGKVCQTQDCTECQGEGVVWR